MPEDDLLENSSQAGAGQSGQNRSAELMPTGR